MKGVCGALIQKPDGSIATCDGKLKERSIYEPFTFSTPIGPGSRATIFSYVACVRCRRMYEPGVAEEDR